MQTKEELKNKLISLQEIIIDLDSFITKEEMNLNLYELISIDTVLTKKNKNDMLFANMKKKRNVIKGFSVDTNNQSDKVSNIFGTTFSTYDNINVVNKSIDYENNILKVFGCNFTLHKELYMQKPSNLEFIGITIPMRRKNTLQSYALHLINNECKLDDYFLFLNSIKFEKQSNIHSNIYETLFNPKIAVK